MPNGTPITIESLGITPAELLERVVDKLAGTLMAAYVPVSPDPESDEEILEEHKSPFMRMLEEKVRAKVDQSVEEIAGRNVLPNVAAFIENYCLQETNRWGEKTGQAMTFTEYLAQRAEHWITEPVNYNGKTKAEDGYSWSKAQTRIAYMIDKHLQYSIKIAIDAALKDFNSTLSGGLTATVKAQLDEALNKMNVKVGPK